MTADSRVANRFMAVSYNILARSLGSNCIPWVMSISRAFQTDVESATGKSWAVWKKLVVLPEYKRHFHKNLGTGDYTVMRQFWSAMRCVSQADVPTSLKGVLFENEDQISYLDKAGQRVIATTMRGLLRSNLPEELGIELFDHIMSLEETVYSWQTRAPRLFAEITRSRTFRAVDSSEDVDMDEYLPDVVMLQEYDAHLASADYRGEGVEESFHSAMAALGYSGALFKDPLHGKTPPSGLGIFWRSASFEPCEDASHILIQGIECGENVPGLVANTDMMERWRPKIGNAYVEEPELMPDADRRNLALLRLRHRETGRSLCIGAVHLMTTSRDSANTNAFPGEVRAGEIATVRSEVQRFVSSGEALLLVGDFNIDAQDRHIFSGQLQNATGQSLKIATGFEAGDDGCKLHWQAKGAHGETCSMCLREAFEPVHRWGAGVGPASEGGHCTSINGERVEWIDYMWYSEQALALRHRSDLSTPAQVLPNAEQGSDHLSIAAVFKFTDVDTASL